MSEYYYDKTNLLGKYESELHYVRTNLLDKHLGVANLLLESIAWLKKRIIWLKKKSQLAEEDAFG